ncbi:MAG: hypothetical protein ABIA04_06550 [Pseudomonadota bacterium]
MLKKTSKTIFLIILSILILTFSSGVVVDESSGCGGEFDETADGDQSLKSSKVLESFQVDDDSSESDQNQIESIKDILKKQKDGDLIPVPSGNIVYFYETAKMHEYLQGKDDEIADIRNRIYEAESAYEKDDSQTEFDHASSYEYALTELQQDIFKYFKPGAEISCECGVENSGQCQIMWSVNEERYCCNTWSANHATDNLEIVDNCSSYPSYAQCGDGSYCNLNLLFRSSKIIGVAH